MEITPGEARVSSNSNSCRINKPFIKTPFPPAVLNHELVLFLVLVVGKVLALGKAACKRALPAWTVKNPIFIDRVGQNHTFIGIYGVYTVYLAGTVLHGVYIRFWPTLHIERHTRYFFNSYFIKSM